MAKIIKNEAFNAEQATADQKGKYLFDLEDGSDVVELKVWIETSKKSDKHPEGKPWIKLPKGNITNREYVSEDMFENKAVNGELPVEVKTTNRVLGPTGVKQNISKYLDEDMRKEYEEMVGKAVEAYRKAKASSKKKKLEDMTIEELQAFIEARKKGEDVSFKTETPKSFMDMFTEEEYNRYNEILAIAQANRANAPKEKRGPLTEEEKIARAKKRRDNEVSKAQALLDKLLAMNGLDAADEEIDEVEEVDEDEELDEDFE